MINKIVRFYIKYGFIVSIEKIFQYAVNVLHTYYCSLKKGVTVEKGALIEFGALIEPDGGKVVVGQHSVLRKKSIIKCYGGVVRIGRKCTLNPYSIIYGHSLVDIGDNVLIAAGSMIVSANHKIDRNHTIRGQGLKLNPIRIGNDVWIGAHVCVLAGVSIEDGVVVAANTTLKRGVYNEYTIYSNPSSSSIDQRRRGENV